ncbi:MAG TPA: EF-Tu/IF-2/RF-3 family GTPase [Thermoplasmata archaeon]|nr:EF-Tu/IF-2/RF-3 family GTPase [Thermoplasmata archaeon]
MTTGVTVAVVGTNELAKELGKKGTASDLTLFNAVRDGHATTLVEPTQFPEKIVPLVDALAMADRCLLAVPELSRSVAEAIATVDVVEVPTTVVLGPGVGEGEIARALKGSRLESADRLPWDLPALRALIEGWTAPVVDGPVRVPLDHAFPVKGVGTVALGVVRQGVLRAHDTLRLWPTAKSVEVRSIQVHDIDRKDAGCGERVGVALRGVEADELARGQVLAPEGSMRAEATLRGGPLTRCRYYRGDVRAGAQLHVAVGLASAPASLDAVGPEGVSVTADRPIPFAPGSLAYLLDLSVPAGPRIVGRFPLARDA